MDSSTRLSESEQARIEEAQRREENLLRMAALARRLRGAT